MSDAPKYPPDTPEDTIMSNEPEKPTQDTPLPPAEPLQNLVHFNPWRDFNDAVPQIDPFGDEPDPDQIAQFMQVACTITSMPRSSQCASSASLNSRGCSCKKP